jgi:hypothetical protein
MRSFSIKNSKKTFRGDKVSDAAKKAAKYLFVKNNKKNFTFCMKETTKNSQNKTYKYKVSIIDSKVNVKKYTGGVHTEYKIGDIVTLYDRHAEGYISYNDNNKDDSDMLKYILSSYNTREAEHPTVYYGLGLVAEKDFRKLSYWKIVGTTTFENVHHGLYFKYIFQLENNNKTPLFFRIQEKKEAKESI